MLDVGRWAYSLHSLQPLRYGVNIWINIIFLGIFRSSARVCWKDDCMACTRVDEGSAKTSRNCIAMHCKYDLHTYLAEKTHIGMVPALTCCIYVLRHAEKEAPKTAIDTVVPHPLATIATSQYCETARKDTVSNSSQGMVEGEIRLKKCSKNT